MKVYTVLLSRLDISKRTFSTSTLRIFKEKEKAVSYLCGLT